MLYVAGQNYDGSDGGGKARMGVATGPALDQLSLHPDFVLEGTKGDLDERSIFPNGALVLENGTVVVTYMGQAADDSWGGIFLASAECAVGCAWQKHGVVLGCAQHNATGADPQVRPLQTKFWAISEGPSARCTATYVPSDVLCTVVPCTMAMPIECRFVHDWCLRSDAMTHMRL